MEQQDSGSPQKQPHLGPLQNSAGVEQLQDQTHTELSQDSGSKEPPQAEVGKSGKGQQNRKQAAAAKPRTRKPRTAKNNKKT